MSGEAEVRQKVEVLMVLRKAKGLVVSVFAWGLVCGGCGGSEPTEPASYTIEEYFKENTEIRCTQAFACCETKELGNDNAVGIDPPPPTVEACIEQRLASADVSWDPIKAAIAAGRLIYNPDRAKACAAKSKVASCIDYFVNKHDEDPDCTGVIAPGVALGGLCDDDKECKDDGTRCLPPADANSPKTCTMKPGVGEPCAAFGICAQEFYCKVETKLCATPGPAGAACDTGADCESNSCTMGACVGPLPPGASCNGGGCEPEGYCDTTTLKCIAKKPDGAPCSLADECESICFNKICGLSPPAPICDGL